MRLDTCKELKKLASLDMISHSVAKQTQLNEKLIKLVNSPLRVYSFENGNTSQFPEPSNDEIKLLSMPFKIKNYH